MAQTSDKIRIVEGTQAKYDASPSTYSNDIYFATDSRKIYARGTPYGAIDDGIWYTLTPYVYDGSTTSYYYIKIAQINDGYSTHFRTLEFDVHDDANYATGGRYWLNLNTYSNTVKNAALISTTIVEKTGQSAKMVVYLDKSGGVWVRFPSVDWGNKVRVRSVLEYGDVSKSIPFYTNPSKQTTAPSNLSNAIEYSGGVRLDSNGTFGYTDAHIYAIVDEATNSDTVDGYHASSIMTFQRQQGLNANNLTGIGVKEVNSGTNMPSTNTWHQVMTWGTQDTGYAFQFANKYTTGNTFYFRQKWASNWQPWYEVIHAANYTNFTVTKTGTGASGTWGISINGSALSIKSTDINVDLNTINTDGRLYYGGGSNTCTNKPTGVDAFGMLSMRTADGWYGQLLMASNNSTGLYWRTANGYTASTGWKKILDTSNYSDYAASKAVATTSSNGLMSSVDKTNHNLLVSNAITGISWSGAKMSWENLQGQAGTYTIPNASTSASGLMSASDKSTLDAGRAKATHNGAITCNRVFTKNDNHGYPVYVLIADCTSTIGTSANGAHKGFTGIIFHKRTGGYISESVATVIARIGYANSSRSLFTTISSIKPCIIVNETKYYIALRVTGSGSEYYMHGYEIGLLSTFTQVNTTDSSGTLPDGYELYVDGTTYYGRAEYANTAGSVGSLSTTRTLWGQNFDGTQNVSGTLSDVTGIRMTSGSIRQDTGQENHFANGTYTDPWSGHSCAAKFSGDVGIGGALNVTGAITGPTSIKTALGDGNRSIRIENGAVILNAATGGWANGVNAYTNDSTTRLGCICGAFGDGNNLTYIYYGGTSYDSPVMVIRNNNVGIGNTNPTSKLHVSGTIYATGEIKSTYQNAFRLASDNYGVILRTDSSYFYFLLTNSGQASTGTWNNLRPFRISLSTGKVYMENGLQVSQPIDNSFVTNSYLNGNQGKALVNSTAAAGSYVALLKGNSTNGYFTTSVHGDKFRILYTAKSVVDAGTNNFSKGITLLDEAGNSEFPGTIKAVSFDGTVTNALSAALASTSVALSSNGRSNALTGKPTNAGLQMFEAYGSSTNYPCTYGNVLRIKGSTATGSGELLLGWSGTSNAVEHIYYRNNRDSVSTWSDWRTVAFTTDNVASATKLQTARSIEGVSFDGTANLLRFGTCSTSAATAAKTVSISSFSLITGARVTVKFSNSNTAANPTLNVNGTGAKSIRYNSTSPSSGAIKANHTYDFVYDGTYWQVIGDFDTDSNTTYGLASNTSNGLMSSTQYQNLNILTSNAITGLTYSGGKLNYETVNSSGSLTLSGVASANQLTTARTIWGQSFNGTGNVSGNMSGVGSIDFSNSAAVTIDAYGNIKLTTSSSNTWWVGQTNPGAICVNHSTQNTGMGVAPDSTARLYVNGIIKSNNEIQSSAQNGLRLSYGNYGTIFRNDGNSLYILLTNYGAAATGTFNSFRPFRIEFASGKVTIGNGLTVNGTLTAQKASTTVDGLMSYEDKKKVDYSILRIPYSIANLVTATKITDSMLSQTEWGTVSNFVNFIKNFAEYGGNAIVEISDPESNSVQCTSGMWRSNLTSSSGNFQLVIEYCGTFRTTVAGTNSLLRFTYMASNSSLTLYKANS